MVPCFVLRFFSGFSGTIFFGLGFASGLAVFGFPAFWVAAFGFPGVPYISTTTSLDLPWENCWRVTVFFTNLADRGNKSAPLSAHRPALL
jgi:hypothetical protein